MTNPSEADQFDLDVRTVQATLEAIDLVAQTFDSEAKAGGLTKARLSERIGRDPAYVARVLNGRVSNVNFQTLARMLIAMGYWPSLKALKIADMGAVSNYCLSEIESGDYKRKSYIASLFDGDASGAAVTTNKLNPVVAHVHPS